MNDELDRVAMLSDLGATESRLKTHTETRLAAEVTRLDKRIDEAFVRLEKRIAEEGKTTRRHFKIMVERVESAVKLVAEVNAHHSTILDDHENRLQKIEKGTVAE